MKYPVIVSGGSFTLEETLERAANWIYCEPDIRTENFHAPYPNAATYDLELYDMGRLVTDDLASAHINRFGMERVDSLQLFLIFLRQYPELLLRNPIVSGVSWESPDGDHGVVYADIGAGDRPKLCIHYADSGFSSRCRFLTWYK